MPRRTIMGGDAPPYRGEDQIFNYYHSAYKEIKRKVRGVIKVQPCPFPLDSQRTFLTLWVSGCRESEGLMLSPDGWKWNDDSIGYRKAPVLKKREKVRDKEGNVIYKETINKVRQQDGSIIDQVIYRPESRQKIEYRDHIMPRDMPLAEELIKIIEYHQERGYDYLLYQRLPFSRTPEPKKPCSVTIVKDRITELHPDLFPHGIRALHVRYLRARYGERFGPEKIKDHFRWSSVEMVHHYLSGQDLADAMGVSVPW